MSKKGSYNSPYFNLLSARLHGTAIRFGILIGSKADDGLRDIVFAAPTPAERGEDGQAVAPPKDILVHLKSKAGPVFVAWATQHVLALQKILPGGLEPCGCFAVVAEAMAKDLAPLVTPILTGIDEAFVLTIDPATRKHSFWQHSGAGSKAVFRPAQLKPDKHKDALLLWASLPIDLAVPRTAIGSGELADDSKASALAVQKAVSDLLNSCICGVSTNDKQALRVVDATSEVALSSVAQEDCDEVRVSFLHSGTCLRVPNDADGGPCLRHRCLVVASALFLRRNVEIRRAVDSLKSEIATSVAERLTLAREEAAATASESIDEGKSVATGRARTLLPWRAFWRPQDTELPMWCGDYCMPDEGATAARESLGQLLGLPDSAFEGAPKSLDELKRLHRNHKGTYEPEVLDHEKAGDGAGDGAVAKGVVGKPTVACLTAVAIVLLAALMPLLLQI